MQFTVDITHLHPAVRGRLVRDLAHEDKARYDLGRVEQLRLKQLHDALPNVALGGELRQTLTLSQDQWRRCMQQYGQRCFADPDFGKFLAKQHEDFRVPDRPTKTMTGWTPEIEPHG